ncbi:hypothetical protein Pelo_11796 [Pelomyxa schiedti]|nr:hypothetical protein Pelo_11796 [Pelomyxa schiedti]
MWVSNLTSQAPPSNPALTTATASIAPESTGGDAVSASAGRGGPGGGGGGGGSGADFASLASAAATGMGASTAAAAAAASVDSMLSPDDSLPDTMFLSLPTTPDFVCPLCLCVPTSAKAQEHEVCGRLFCDTCLAQLCNDKHDACPFCSKSLHKTCRSVKEKNLFLFRLLEGLSVRCVNHSRGCKYVGEWKHMRTHVERDCTYVPKMCPVVGCKHNVTGDSKHNTDDAHTHILLLQDQITDLLAKVKDLEKKVSQISEQPPTGNQVVLVLKKPSASAQRLVVDFNCVGQRWQIRIFPDGDSSSDKANCAVYLENLSHSVFDPSINVSVQQRDLQFKTKTLIGGPKYPFTPTNPCWGWSNFCPKKDLPDDNITVLVLFNA